MATTVIKRVKQAAYLALVDADPAPMWALLDLARGPNGAEHVDDLTLLRGEPDRITLHTAGSTPEVRDQVSFSRRFPTANGNFRGMQKCTVKSTCDHTVTGKNGEEIVSPVIIETNIGIPVGVTAEQALKMVREHALILLDQCVAELAQRGSLPTGG